MEGREGGGEGKKREVKGVEGSGVELSRVAWRTVE